MPKKNGVYLWEIDNEIVYVGRAYGRSMTSFNRFRGYGHIPPRPRFKGGQSTYLKMNNVVLNEYYKGRTIHIWYTELKAEEAEQLEKRLIDEYSDKLKYNSKKA